MLIKTFSAFDYAVKQFEETITDLVRVRLRAALFTKALQSGLSVVAAAGPALLLIVGAWLALRGQTTIGVLVTFLTLQGRLYAPVARLSGLKLSLVTAKNVIERIDEVLHEPHQTGGDAAFLYEASIEADCIEYIVDGRPVVPKTSFTVPFGSSVAIVGPSGAGKSSLLLLMARIYDPVLGNFSADGIPFERISLDAIRHAITLVPQQSFFFTMSILDNLRLADPKCTIEEINACLLEMECAEFISSAPEGLQSIIGSGSLKLSGGEQQRLALARALIARPRVLLIDEGTSALDAECEDRILRRLYGRKGLTIVHATHRPERLPVVDCVIRLGAVMPETKATAFNARKHDPN